MSFDIKIDMNPIHKILKDRGLQDFGPIQKFVDKRVIEYAEPYTPGIHLTTQALISTDFGSGEVLYNSPDAHYLHHGVVMEDPVTHSTWARKYTQKVYRDQKIKYHGGGQRGKDWINRMWLDKQKDLVKEVQAKVDRRGK